VSAAATLARAGTRARAICTALALGLLIAGLAPARAPADTLADALAAAYRNSNLLEQNRALLRAADEDVVQAQARLLPVVNFITRFLTSASGTPDYRISFGIAVDFPLIDFGRGRLGLDLAREQVLSARAGLLVVEQRVLLSAVAAYLNLYAARQTLALRQNNVAVVGRRAQAARERFELGDGTRTEVALAEARLAAARSAEAAAEGDAAVAREDFRFVVGRYPGALAPPPRLPRLPRSLDAAQAHARRHHPAILQAQHQVAAADLVVRIARTERLGTLAGSLSVETRRQRIGVIEDTSSDLTVSLGYQVPLYTGGRIPSVERQAVARAEAQRAALNQTVAQVNAAVASAWAQLEVARAQLEATDLQIAAAETALAAVSAEAEFGTRTTLDVLDAEQDLLDARTARLFAEIGVQRAAYALLEATGQLTVTSLGLGIPTYDVEAYAAAFRRRQGGASDVAPSPQGQRLDRIRSRWDPPLESER
jgi:outer membrane protein